MAEQPRIIGVSGFMRTGKDSVAELLITQYGYTRIAFADALRNVARDIDPYISLEGCPSHLVQDITGSSISQCATYTTIFDMIGYERAKEIPDFRRFLQRLGTEGIRNNFGEDAWVNLAMETVDNALVPNLGGPRFVMPDCRFPNEADSIRDRGGVIWRTLRPGFGGGDHPSEAMVERIVPDYALLADNLISLGLLVQEGLGVPEDVATLESWANAILERA